MPRSSASASTALLLSVAVSVTASGCVGVEQSAGPRPAATPVSPTAPRTDGRSRPQIEQPPGREVLQRVDPPRRPAPRSPAADVRPAVPPPRAEQPKPKPPPVRRPPAARPDAGATRPAPPSRPPAADVCALGEAYGGWQPDSPQAVICRKTYGR
ncbi:hypothetical protein [Streptomyces sp. WAC 01529]|uniref:hypothetical protein n=1 Tax=Streptomyces sp. WAC 01529 TaxID=2203205 RepID=UPI000F73F721|nr:hypothetical protein [Streptomyces sp. WAC 01529]